ncbi:MAG: DUF4349 domain-containing protein, partial [Coleofasciculus sp. S288]|nr:DUF4349 domain-containing protein [Coleofasciculus sp. S288]
MNCPTHSLLKPTLLLSTLLGSLLLASCNAASNMQSIEQKAQMSMPPAAAPAGGDASVRNESASVEVERATNQVPQSRPQLVKTAEIALVVNSIDQTLQQASQIIQQQQGDVLGLQNDKPQNSNRRETAFMQIRVPQGKLETTLDALAKLGTVQRRNLSGEDVTNQLVDFQARLRNLRKTESSLLQIMNRSGSVGD